MNPWSAFWKQGHPTTFGPYFPEGYDGAIAEWWRKGVAALEQDFRVLEVGCGNCSLLPGLAESGVAGKYIGLDIARVEPSAYALEKIKDTAISWELHSETPAEKIPEPDDSVDLVASVFGIEYSSLSESLPEVFRVIRQGGHFKALVHHADSVVTRMSKRAHSEYKGEEIEVVLGLLQKMSDLRETVSDAKELPGIAEAESVRNELNQYASKYLSDKNPATANITMFEFMSMCLRFFQMLTQDKVAREKYIAFVRSEMTSSHERYRQMVEVARDEAAIQAFVDELRGLGFDTESPNVVSNDKEVLAWEISAKKA